LFNEKSREDSKILIDTPRIGENNITDGSANNRLNTVKNLVK
jgi:hypothetical protein